MLYWENLLVLLENYKNLPDFGVEEGILLEFGKNLEFRSP